MLAAPGKRGISNPKCDITNHVAPSAGIDALSANVFHNLTAPLSLLISRGLRYMIVRQSHPLYRYLQFLELRTCPN